MTNEEIIEILRVAAALDVNEDYPSGSIADSAERDCVTPDVYKKRHYPMMCKMLESLPWTMTVKNPRNPQKDEYPSEEGEYLTMLDCNEHEVCHNTFRDGHWTLYNRTHVKWWMPMPRYKFKKGEIISKFEDYRRGCLIMVDGEGGGVSDIGWGFNNLRYEDFHIVSDELKEQYFKTLKEEGIEYKNEKFKKIKDGSKTEDNLEESQDMVV